MIYVSGQIPKDITTGEWGTTVEEQTLTCLHRIKAIIEQHNAHLADIVKTTVYLTDIRDYAKMNQTYLSYFRDQGVTDSLPARTVIEMGKSTFPDWFLVIDCIAIRTR